jgi:hypothetical protein
MTAEVRPRSDLLVSNTEVAEWATAGAESRSKAQKRPPCIKYKSGQSLVGDDGKKWAMTVVHGCKKNRNQKIGYNNNRKPSPMPNGVTKGYLRHDKGE